MRILSPIVRAQALHVESRQSHLGLCRAVRAQFVGHQHIGREALFLEQLTNQFHGCSLIAPWLHKQVENLAFVVDGPPEPELPPRHRYGHLVEMPARPLAADADGEVPARTEARTSRPSVAPFRR